MQDPTNQDTPSLEFSLVRGDLPYRLQRRIGLIPREGLGLVRRALFWSMLGWLPIALWALYVHRALPGELAEPLLSHFGIHARLLVAVPLLILAEGPAQALAALLLPQLVRSGTVPPRTLPAFKESLAATRRLHSATAPWIVLLAIVAVVATTSEIVSHAHEIDWASDAAPGRGTGFGGLWYLYVGRSIYFAFLLGWLWRIVLLTTLFWRVARLDLEIVPTHPDRTGGLAFLERLPAAFAPIALAVSLVAASRWAHDAVYHDLMLQSLRVEMIAVVVLLVVLFVLPLFAFGAPLRRAKRQALLDYGALVGRHGRLVRQRWIDGRPIDDDAVLEAPELGPVADTAAIYDAVTAMRTVPIGKISVLPIALAAALPMLAVLATEVPVKEMLLTLLKALV